MIKRIIIPILPIVVLITLLYPVDAQAGSKYSIASQRFLENQDSLDLYCLQISYPQISGIETSGAQKRVLLSTGQHLPYAQLPPDTPGYSVKQAMEQPYPLDPERPDTPDGYSPGRKRPYILLEKIYGISAEEVRKNLLPVKAAKKTILLAPEAARSLKLALARMKHLETDPQKARLLHPDGGFFWRNIAGEPNRSAHSYGIAVDLGAKYAPYWRWSKQNPHPMQKTYPSEIVRIMEEEGFIWGGKWHEYDLMHFEYRPELICKARMKKAMKR